jgi:hypothetical protein
MSLLAFFYTDDLPGAASFCFLELFIWQIEIESSEDNPN